MFSIFKFKRALARTALIAIVVVVIIIIAGGAYAAVSLASKSTATSVSTVTATSVATSVVTSVATSVATSVVTSVSTQSVTTTASTANETQVLSKLYALAKPEGGLDVIGSLVSTSMNPLISLFESDYPGIPVTYTIPSGGSAAVGSTIISQFEANKVQEDLTLAGIASGASSMATAGALNTTINWNVYGVPKTVQLPNSSLDLFDQLYVWAYNTNLVPAAQVPQTYAQLINPVWSGEITEFVTGNCFQSLAIQNYTYAVQEINELKTLNPLIDVSAGANTAAIVSGQVALGCDSLNTVIQAMAAGSPIGITPVGPAQAAFQSISLVTGAPHPYAALLFAAFLETNPLVPQILYSTNYYGLIGQSCSANLIEATICSDNLSYILPTNAAQIDAETNMIAYSENIFGPFSTGK